MLAGQGNDVEAALGQAGMQTANIFTCRAEQNSGFSFM